MLPARNVHGLVSLLRLCEIARLRDGGGFYSAPLLDQLARLGLRSCGRPPCFKQIDVVQAQRSGMTIEIRQEAVSRALNRRKIALCVVVAPARLEQALDRRSFEIG